MDQQIGTDDMIHCACVIHGTGYSWEYVDKLHSMLSRNLSQPIQLHVYTEHDRFVPDPMIKHELLDLGVSGPKKSWWYKLQLFNRKHYSGPLLYFDLDVVITNNIDWIVQQSTEYFWAPRDFARLWNPWHTGINSSVMWWDTEKFHDVWSNFKNHDFSQLQREYRGDQDFLNVAVDQRRRRFLDENLISSWKWECFNGGYDFQHRAVKAPGTGTKFNDACVLVFHGNPKPAEINDPVILQHWK